MADSSDLIDASRRAVLGAAAAALGVAATGTASAHEWQTGEESGPAGENTWVSAEEDTRGETEHAEVVGYHALGSVRTARRNRSAEAQEPHYGGVTEITTHGEYAYVGVFSSDSPTPGRGMAVLDISDYTRIPADASPSEQAAMLDNAELSVVSFLRNNNTGVAVMDVKVSGDGRYAFLSTQPYTALFGGLPQTNSDDPTHSEAADPTPNTSDESFTGQPAGIVAVDVSDPANPRRLGSFALEGTGCHNAYHHRIDGEDYVFGIQDSGNLAGVGEGMFVLRFDRSSGRLELVNQWEYETNLRQGGVDAQSASGGAYIHDMEVQDDPRTGTPVVYLAYWDRGTWALDASDPEDLRALGRFDMGASHFASPAPTLVNGKRVAVTSQEISASDAHTGRVYLVDADGLFESDPDYDAVPRTDEGFAEMGELAMWEWQSEHQYPGRANAVEFGPYDFSLSPHNSDFAKHVDPNSGEESFWIHQAHYGGGVQYLRVKPGEQNGLIGADERFRQVDEDPDDDGLTGADGPHHGTDWKLQRQGYSRPTYGTPTESRIEGLNYITPFVWGASQENGITFASDINQGVHAVKHDRIPIGGASPVVGITRTDDGRLFTAGQTDQVDLSVDFADRTVVIRDRVPSDWRVLAGDAHRTETAGGSTYVEFDASRGSGDAATYFVEAPDETGTYQFGPVEVSADGGDTWHEVAGTRSTETVIGQSTTLPAGIGMAGAVGVLAHQRERVADRVRPLLER